MEKYNTENLYVVRPSIVVYDDTKLINQDLIEMKQKYIHIAKFEQKYENIGIAYKESLSLEDIFDEKIIIDSAGIPNHCCEGDLYVNVMENDIILLAEYLYKRKIKNTKWTKELQEYIISLKPYYTENELLEIKDIFANNTSKETNVKTYKRKYTIRIGFYNI